MKFKKIDEVNEFKGIVNNAKGNVWAEDKKGDSFNLKDEKDQYVVIGEMIHHGDEEMEIFASDSDDDAALENFFIKESKEEDAEAEKTADKGKEKKVEKALKTVEKVLRKTDKKAEKA